MVRNRLIGSIITRGYRSRRIGRIGGIGRIGRMGRISRCVKRRTYYIEFGMIKPGKRMLNRIFIRKRMDRIVIYVLNTLDIVIDVFTKPQQTKPRPRSVCNRINESCLQSKIDRALGNKLSLNAKRESWNVNFWVWCGCRCCWSKCFPNCLVLILPHKSGHSVPSYSCHDVCVCEGSLWP